MPAEQSRCIVPQYLGPKPAQPWIVISRKMIAARGYLENAKRKNQEYDDILRVNTFPLSSTWPPSASLHLPSSQEGVKGEPRSCE